MIELAVVAVLQLIYLAYLTREHSRADAAARDALAAAQAAHSHQVSHLLQRIQAPEAAVVAHQIATAPPPPLELPWDDDEAFHKTREQLADELP